MRDRPASVTIRGRDPGTVARREGIPMRILLLVAAGGAVGALLRYVLAGWGQRLTVGTFPVGTLLVNLVGCFAIGYLAAVFAGPWLLRSELKVALLVGLLGGFTTFSSYAFETFALLAEGRALPALANVLLSNLVGLFAVWVGYRLADVWPGV